MNHKFIKDTKSDLEPFTLDKIQVCPVCGKVDVYKDDGHSCVEHVEKENHEKWD